MLWLLYGLKTSGYGSMALRPFLCFYVFKIKMLWLLFYGSKTSGYGSMALRPVVVAIAGWMVWLMSLSGKYLSNQADVVRCNSINLCIY